MIASFLWKIHKSKHKRFLKRKKNVHLEGERNERFPWMPKWAWMFAWLDKQSNRWNTGLIWMGKQTLSLSVCMATKPYVWVSTWMCAMINFAWISNYHNMRFMEMIWVFPSFWAIGQIDIMTYIMSRHLQAFWTKHRIFAITLT